EWAIVIGNPLGEDFFRSVTVGTVSSLERSVSQSVQDKYGRKTTVENSMIQVDAAINSGNSGGGMFNTLGQPGPHPR
ncbi:MAG: trypsin-like peptidase domain-containing protein, partial [Akkermansia sp.]|nr:trypsin-like peptidase domain-containing protein [Akkermansia sp.]